MNYNKKKLTIHPNPETAYPLPPDQFYAKPDKPAKGDVRTQSTVFYGFGNIKQSGEIFGGFSEFIASLTPIRSRLIVGGFRTFIKTTTNRNILFGAVGGRYRLPLTLRVIIQAGWYGVCYHPLTIIDNSVYDNFYVPGGSNGHLEPAPVDYPSQLFPLLETYCSANGIGLFMETSEFFGNGPFGANFDPQLGYPGPLGATNHPARWLKCFSSLKPTIDSFGIGTQTDPSTIVGGINYTIVFASDGLDAYHGFSNDIGTYVVAQPTAYYDEDLNQLATMYPRFQKFGGLLVNSPKAPEFFPCYYTPAPVDQFGDGRTLCYTDARVHMDAAASDIAPFGIDYMTRSFGVHDGSDEPHFANHTGHLIWTGAPPSVASIMDKVRNFFGF